MELAFNLSNLAVLPFWALMILAPHWSSTKRLMSGLWMVAALGLVYAGLLLPQIGGVAGSLANPTLAGIAALLGTPAGAAVGWVHFLAFDLFVGRWIYLDSRQQPVTAWLASAALFLTFMAGPLGLVIYLAGRALLARRSPVKV